MKALRDAVLPGFPCINVLPDHPLFCEPVAEVVGDEFRAVIATQDPRNTVGLERRLQDSFYVHGGESCATADGYRAPGEFVSQGQDLQGCSLAGLVEDKIISPDVVRELGPQREMLSGADLSAQPPGGEGQTFSLPDLVNCLAVHHHALPYEGRMHPSASPARVLKSEGFDPH